MTGSPKWDVGCSNSAKDQFGDSKRRYCWLFVNNSGNPGIIMDDNSYAMKLETLFEIDAKGAHFIKPKKADRLCAKAPQRIAVDGVRIDSLSEAKQIEAVLSGARLVREEQAKWPYCGIAPHGTFLHGVREGFARLQAQWKAINP